MKSQFLIAPSDDFEGRFIFDLTERDESCCPATYSHHGIFAQTVRDLGGDTPISIDGDVGVNAPPYEDVKDHGVTFHGNWNLDFADFETVITNRKFTVKRGQDVDFSNLDIYQLGNTVEEFDSRSLELRLVGSQDNVDWLVGVIYGQEKITSAGRFLELASEGPNYFVAILPTSYAAAGLPEGTINALVGNARTDLMAGMGLRGAFAQDADFWALFTHNSWHLSDRVDLTLGLRYSKESKEGGSIINGTGTADTVVNNWPCVRVPVTTFCGNAGYSLSRSDNEPTGTLKVSYTFSDDVSGYASVSRGYKSGGFNLDPTSYKLNADGVATTDSREFKPEIANMTEFGLKSVLADGALTLNLALWEGKIEDFQLNTFEGAFFTVNSVPRVNTYGVELEYTWWLSDNVRFSGGITNANTRYGDSAGTAVGKSELDGKRLTNSAEWQASSAVFVEVPMSDTWNFRANVNMFHRGRHNTGSSLGPLKWQNAYNLVNAQLGVRRTDDRYEITAWVNNAFDTDYRTVIFNSVSQSGSRSTFVGEPRIYGLTLKANFQ